MKFLKSFGKFWYDFIIGDDWKIAVAVVCAILAACGLMVSKVFGDATLSVAGGVLVVVFFAVSLAIDVRPTKR
jgi:hypothetical protein